MPRLKYVQEVFPSRKSSDPYLINQFNLTASEKLLTNRKIPETREAECLLKKNLQFPEDLPSVSVVICFYNEARSTLYRTVRRYIF